MLFIKSCKLHGTLGQSKMTSLWWHHHAFEIWQVKKSAIGLVFFFQRTSWNNNDDLIYFLFVPQDIQYVQKISNKQIFTKPHGWNVEINVRTSKQTGIWECGSAVIVDGVKYLFIHSPFSSFLLLALIFLVPGYLEMVGRLKLYPLHILWICTCPTSSQGAERGGCFVGSGMTKQKTL